MIQHIFIECLLYSSLLQNHCRTLKNKKPSDKPVVIRCHRHQGLTWAGGGGGRKQGTPGRVQTRREGLWEQVRNRAGRFQLIRQTFPFLSFHFISGGNFGRSNKCPGLVLKGAAPELDLHSLLYKEHLGGNYTWYPGLRLVKELFEFQKEYCFFF